MLKLNCLTFSLNLGQSCAYNPSVHYLMEKKEQGKVSVLMQSTFAENRLETFFNLANT